MLFRPKKNIILYSMVSLALVVTGTIVAVMVTSQAGSSPATPINSAPLAAVANTETWTEYWHKDFGFRLKLPPGVAVADELDDGYNRVVIFAGSLDFSISLRAAADTATSLDRFLYLDFPPTGETVIAGQPAKIFQSAKGYCDAGQCGPAFTTYAMLYEDTFYLVVFQGDDKMSAVEQTILDSFQFIN